MGHVNTQSAAVLRKNTGAAGVGTSRGKNVEQSLIERVRNIATFADLSNLAIQAGEVVRVGGHTYEGIGATTYLAKAGSITNDGGTKVNCVASPGVFMEFMEPVVCVDHFGADPTGAVDSSFAFNLAIAYGIARGGYDRANVVGTTIRMSDGRYVLDLSLNAITKSYIKFVGHSKEGTVLLLKNGTTTFTWGDGVNTVIGGGISNCRLEYLVAPSATTIVAKFSYAFGQTFNDIALVNVGILGYLGTSSTAIAGEISFYNISGSVNNGGRGLFSVRYGAGLYLNNFHCFVLGVGNPSLVSFTGTTSGSVLTVTAITGTPLAVGQVITAPGIAAGTTISSLGTGVGGTGTYNLSTSSGTLASQTFYASGSMTTVAGTNVFNCAVGFWDTLQCTNCIFERFNVLLNITATSGMVYQNFFFSNVVSDYVKQYIVYADSQSGGVISTIRFDKSCWFSTWDADAIYINGVGYNDCHEFSGTITIAGLRGVYCSSPSAKNIKFDMNVFGTNRLGNAAAAMEFAAGSKGFKSIGCSGNVDATNLGVPWRAQYGVQVLADCDQFIIDSCDFVGSVGGYNVVPVNASGSANRRIGNNINANYAGNATAVVPASNVTYTNKSAMVEDWSFFGGTITSGYVKNGVGFPGALSYLNIRLQPGDTYSVGYSVAPIAKLFIEP